MLLMWSLNDNTCNAVTRCEKSVATAFFGFKLLIAVDQHICLHNKDVIAVAAVFAADEEIDCSIADAADNISSSARPAKPSVLVHVLTLKTTRGIKQCKMRRLMPQAFGSKG